MSVTDARQLGRAQSISFDQVTYLKKKKKQKQTGILTVLLAEIKSLQEKEGNVASAQITKTIPN
jgi:hypothetical protein